MAAEKKKQTNVKKFTSYVITIACLAVFVYAAHGLIDVLLDYYQNRKVINDVQDIYYQEADSHSNSYSEEKGIRSGFDELIKFNKHVVGWITIEDTQIDYPILQTDNNTDFMYHNFYGEESRAGSIFMDYRNDITMKDNNIIVYGHRMKDGSMFQHLTKFLDEDFFETHRTFTIDTLYDSYEAEIFAVYPTMVNFNYIQTDFSNEKEFENLIEEIQNKSKFKTDVDISSEDQMITLSTCDYTLDPEDGRLVVHAKLTKKEAYGAR